jgi:uncharacterized glyoxalase superfamily protein PhnB
MTPMGTRFHVLELVVADMGRSEVDATYKRLTSAGYEGHLQPFDAFWAHRYAVVHDPDGNPVDFFYPLAG